MKTVRTTILGVLCLCAALSAHLTAAAQTQPAAPAHQKHATAALSAAPAPNGDTSRDADTATQHQLIQLLRLSPTLTTVVAHDPSLLADQEYVSRNNPQLAAFLAAHPEVARNPNFYLFTHLHGDGTPDEALQRAVWPELYRGGDDSGLHDLLRNLAPLLAFASFLAAVVWAIRLFVESRRWSRIFKMQTDVHSRLIDKFGSTQELAAYMQTEAGRRFLEAAPIPLDAQRPRVPNAAARVLTPLQVGVVLVLLGVGFLALRSVGPDYEVPMRVLGILILMPGIGFILSAGLTWVLASRMGLMPAADRTETSLTERH